MKLILHAGVHRTGTTSIQKYLAHNREALSDQGFVYPGDNENHQEIAWGLLRGSLSAAQFAAAMSANEGRTVILSAEDLCRIVKLPVLQQMTAPFDVHAIIFVRRQDDWLESWYNQNIKWPFHPTHAAMSPLEFLGTVPEYFWLEYDTLLRRWYPYCSKLDVLVFDEIEDSVDAFCRYVDIDQSRLVRPDGRANSSLGPASLEIVRHLGMSGLSQSTRGAVLRAVRSFEAMHPDAGGAVFPASVKRLIMERFQGSNQRLSGILERGNAPLFPARVAEPAANVDLPDGRTMLRDFVGPLLHMLERSARRKERAR